MLTRSADCRTGTVMLAEATRAIANARTPITVRVSPEPRIQRPPDISYGARQESWGSKVARSLLFYCVHENVELVNSIIGPRELPGVVAHLREALRRRHDAANGLGYRFRG